MGIWIADLSGFEVMAFSTSLEWSVIQKMQYRELNSLISRSRPELQTYRCLLVNGHLDDKPVKISYPLRSEKGGSKSNQNQKPFEKKFATLAARAVFVSSFLLQKRPICKGVWNLPHKFHLYLISETDVLKDPMSGFEEFDSMVFQAPKTRRLFSTIFLNLCHSPQYYHCLFYKCWPEVMHNIYWLFKFHQ